MNKQSDNAKLALLLKELSTTVQSNFVPFLKRPILLLFSDDSTLFFARRMRDCLFSVNPDLTIHMGWVVDENALSYRQMAQLLPEGPDIAVHERNSFADLMAGKQYSAILTSRVYGALDAQLCCKVVSVAAERPCVVAFLGGLDFFPRNGYFRRRNCDAIYLFPKSELLSFERLAESWSDRMWQEIGFGHPSFLEPQPLGVEVIAKRRDIYFFTQALSPSTRRGRQHMLRAMIAIARANPERTIWIKLRHLPGENRKHLHLEKYDYPSLLAGMEDAPKNLQFTACTMDEALENAAIGITCTSTAAIDVIRAGVPCMVHLDFVDNYMDPLVEPMRSLFGDSRVITSLEDMLNLQHSDPNPDWIDDMFCSRDLGTRVMNTIANFADRPFQLTSND